MTVVLMSTFGSYGNTVPFLRLGEALCARGHEVHLWTNYPQNLHPASGLHIHAVGRAADYDRFTADAALLNRFQTIPEVFRRHYLPIVPLEFAEMEDRVQPGRTIVIANDAPGVSARLLSEKYRTPLISIFTYPNQLSAASIIGQLLGSTLREEMYNLRATLGLTEALDPRAWWNQPNLYLALWPAWFAREPVVTDSRVRFQGFFYYDPEPAISADCEQFLAHPDPCVLITGGSANFASAAFVTHAVGAVRAAGLRAIVVSPRSTSACNDILQKEHVPSLASLMAKVRVVVHHGGMGTIGQAIRAGVPQFALADGGDRPENGLIIEQLGLGRFLPRSEWEVDTLGGALLSLMNSSETNVRCKAASERIDEPAGLEATCVTLERMADRAQLTESCVFPHERDSMDSVSSRIGADLTQALSELSPERRYALARALRSRRL